MALTFAGACIDAELPRLPPGRSPSRGRDSNLMGTGSGEGGRSGRDMAAATGTGEGNTAGGGACWDRRGAGSLTTMGASSPSKIVRGSSS